MVVRRRLSSICWTGPAQRFLHLCGPHRFLEHGAAGHFLVIVERKQQQQWPHRRFILFLSLVPRGAFVCRPRIQLSFRSSLAVRRRFEPDSARASSSSSTTPSQRRWCGSRRAGFPSSRHVPVPPLPDLPPLAPFARKVARGCRGARSETEEELQGRAATTTRQWQRQRWRVLW